MRECGECTKCCEGNLILSVNGRTVNKSNPCHYLSKTNKCGGCTIYDSRPKVCSDFQCDWIENSEIPEWLKPSSSNVILIDQNLADVPYYEVVETDGKIDSVVLNWILLFAIRNKMNLLYQVNGNTNMFGSAAFLEYMKKRN